jgi:thiol:disulfide interchange protein DsbC
MLKRAGLIAAALFAMTAAQAADEDMSALLKGLMPGMDISDVKQLENTGMYEAVVNGDVLYFSKDLRYAFKGDVVEIATRENITEAKRIDIRKQALAEIKPADLIVYPSDESKFTITVFTDIDCGYCRKLHQQIDDYNKQGITVRYMAFPRAGVGSESYDKAVNVWCADDRQKAMTMSKQGKTVASKQCENPVKAQYELGGRMGVQGTPAIFLESGDIIPGYVPPVKLREILEQQG